MISSVTAAPPMMWRRSRTPTDRPDLARYAAEVRPLWPPPMISASHFVEVRVEAVVVTKRLVDRHMVCFFF